MQDKLSILPLRKADEPRRVSRYDLPVPLTALVGREQEVAAVCRLLSRPGVRLATLTGTGGVGKTRLAMQAAAELREDFADGVSFVSLAPLSQPDRVLPALAQTFDLKETPDWLPLEHLKAYLREKQLLVLLDNFEQVIAAAPLLVALLQACPALKMLVTSRVRLRVSGEHEYSVQPLALPDPKHLPDHATLLGYAAVALFVQRAQALKPNFQLTAGNARTIAEVCLHLDGLPLAIELAAARIKLLSPQALLARLSHRLQLLTGGVQDAPARQQTLRNTIAWSYDLLDAVEQQLFRRISVFVGGCTVQAIEAVCTALDRDAAAESVLDGIASLLDKSLLQQTEQEGEEPRLVMLETIREYGWEALATHGEVEATQRAHAAYYLVLTEEIAPRLTRVGRGRWLKWLQHEHENLRTSLAWLVEHEEWEAALRLGGALWQFWWMLGHLSEGRTEFARALAGSQGAVTTPVRAKALHAASTLAAMQGDLTRASALLEESLALARQEDYKQAIASSLFVSGQVAQQQGDLALARSLLEESLGLFKEMGDRQNVAQSLVGLAGVSLVQGDYATARTLFEESFALFKAGGNKWFIAVCLAGFGALAVAQGAWTWAARLSGATKALCEVI